MFSLLNNHNKTKIYVDFENVKLKGLEGLEELTERDTVFLFYSKNAEMLTVPIYESIKKSKANVETIECLTGNNAMDFVISTLLGSHIKTDEEKTKYFIVSKDKGYDAVIDFWKTYDIKRILNLRQIKNANLEVAEEETLKEKEVQKNKHINKVKKATQVAVKKKKHEINVRSRIGMLIKGLKKVDMNQIEEIVKNGNEKSYLKLLNEIFGNKGNEYYTKLKPLFSELKKQ